MNLDHLRDLVIRPTLKHIELWSPASENLVLGTALVESKAEYLRQLQGPALGLWQMEPETHDDIWENYLRYQHELGLMVTELTTSAALTEGSLELIGNLYYGAAMCRVHYRRVTEPLPDDRDAQGMARYWKRYYNTSKGAGTVEKAVAHFIVACAP
jgi:hypothetical protein